VVYYLSEITPESPNMNISGPQDPDFELTVLLLSYDLCPIRILYGYAQSEDCYGCGDCVMLGLTRIFTFYDYPNMMVPPLETEVEA